MTSRVILICQLAYPELVSTGLTITELAEGLVREGVEVTVIAGPMTVMRGMARPPREIRHAGVVIKRVGGTTFLKRSMPGRILNHLTFVTAVGWYLMTHSIKAPLLCWSNPPVLPWVVAVVAWIKRLRWGVVIFDVYPDAVVEAGLLSNTHVLIRWWRCLNRWALNRAHRVVVIGRCMADRVRALYDPRRWSSLVTIHVWADNQGIQAGEGDYRTKWGVADAFVVGYAGNMARFHDLMTMMNAADALRDHPRIRFVMVGDGHQKNELMAYATDRLLPNVQFHAYVPREQRGAMLRTFDVGVVSLNDAFAGVSVPSKSFGLMAAGVPMVGLLPAHSEMAYVIQEEGCGWVVAPGDTQGFIQAVCHACERPDQCQEKGMRGQKAIESTYSLQQAVWQYRAVIEGLGGTSQIGNV